MPRALDLISRMVKVLEPIADRLVTNTVSILVMAVRIPMSAVIPMAIMAMVSDDLNRLLRMAFRASWMLSSQGIWGIDGLRMTIDEFSESLIYTLNAEH